MGADAALRLEGVRKAYPTRDGETEVLGNITFTQKWGEFLAIVGPSGCGKTTLLRLLAGLSQSDGGTVLHDGKQLDGPPEWLGLVFQDYTRSLFPWLTVRRNVTLGPRQARGRKAAKARHDAADEALAAVNLAGFGDHYPWQLSGGMQQRVALARALLRSPRLLLLDEPFASVDAQTKLELQSMVLRLREERGFTALLVTHDIDEAVFMADRILVLSNRPTSVIGDVAVALDRPRDQLTTRSLPEFGALREEMFERMGIARTAVRATNP